jgi:endonuclease YncB( thermonuclease family)
MALPNHLLITGNFVIIGKEPDGDSVRFVADDPSLYAKLEDGHRAVVSKDGSIQLRFEGVDATELHYGQFAQPLGDKARDELLGWMGFTKIKLKPGSTLVESAEPACMPGTILSKKVELHGRPVAFVLLAEKAAGLSDGEIILLDRTLLEQTLNWRLLETGWAYYTVYTSTPLRDDLREAASRARSARHGKGRGVWEFDSTREFKLVDRDSIGPGGTEILPKLFRRCTDYLTAVAKGFEGELSDWMIANSGPPRRENDRVVLPDKSEVHLSELISQRNSTIVFQPDLLEIAFVEK